MNDKAVSAKQTGLPRWMRVGLLVSAIMSFIAVAVMTFKAVKMVQDGRGWESYRTYWLVEDTWIGFLVFLACVLVSLLLALVFQWRERRQWRELERKYGQRPMAPRQK